MQLTHLFGSLLLGGLGLAMLAAPAPAQDTFYATINGAQETPPNASPAIGRGWFHLDLASNNLWYHVESSVVGGTMAHIHLGAPGVAGPIIFPLAGGPANYDGVVGPLTVAQIQNLYSGLFYANIHTVALPGGEIRGQITKTYTRKTVATLSGLSEVPPSPSPGVGTATVYLHVPSNVVTYRMTASGLFGGVTMAHIHQGPVGVNGPIIVTLNGGPTGPNSGEWCGTGQLTPAQAALFTANGLYVNVHTVPFGGGEIRGQLMVQKEEFATRLSGAEETPPVPTANTGFGSFIFDPISMNVIHTVTWTGAAGTMAHVHTAIPTIAGPITYPLIGPPNGPWAGPSGPQGAAAIDDLFNERQYANIHSVPFPGGEIRGQIRENPNIFGYPGVTTAGPLGRVLRIGASGAPHLGQAWSGTVCDAIPGNFVSLAYATDLFGMPLDLAIFGFPGQVLWVNALTGYPTAADANGCAVINFTVPPIPGFVGSSFYFQWIGIEAASIVMSDAMQVWVVP